MFIESVALTNFRCFGDKPQTIRLSKGLTCFIGANGAGKTAVMLALQRMFGISAEQRRIRRRDFHVPADEMEAPSERTLSIEVILAFPELATGDEEEDDTDDDKDDDTDEEEDDDEDDDTDEEDSDSCTVPEFFRQMAAEDGGILKCRLRLDATWTNDGSLDGAIEEKLHAIHTFTPKFTDEDLTQLKPGDRSRIQMIYVPALRDASAHVTGFLRGRLWRAITWSESLQETLQEAGTTLNDTFGRENAVAKITAALKQRWGEVHDAGVNAAPVFQPIDLRLQEFIRKVELVFRPDEEGRDANIEELSDGQRSLLQIAMTAAILDVESQIRQDPSALPINMEKIAMPALTLLAVEEPENNLAPFYLSRILGQIKNLVERGTAQALVSSHSASIVARVSPEDLRYFKLDSHARSVSVKEIPLPADDEEAEKYVREAVRTYPELYFARFVILGEGSSEEVVLPRMAEAMKLPIDPSFVAIVPLGGRHVNHLWRLLKHLDIPYATLLDLDLGRAGGGWGRIKYVCKELIAVKTSRGTLLSLPPFQRPFGRGNAYLNQFDTLENVHGALMKKWIRHLRQFGVFFCDPLDLDMCMLEEFCSEYQTLVSDMRGPQAASDAKRAVFGGQGKSEWYEQEWDKLFDWYRYLFLGRGKPSTHLRVLSGINAHTLARRAPTPIRALLNFVRDALGERDDNN